MNIVDIISGAEEFKSRFKDAVENKENATKFWNIYNPQPIELLRNNQYHMLRERMFKLLRTCKQIDKEGFEKIHKGHPYFFIGITSYNLGDYQTAISFFDAALSEELKFEGKEEGPTRLFFMLRGNEPRNAAQLETQFVETKVKRSIDYYNNEITKGKDILIINIQDMRDVFLSTCWIIKMIQDFERYSPHSLPSWLSGILEMNILILESKRELQNHY